MSIPLYISLASLVVVLCLFPFIIRNLRQAEHNLDHAAAYRSGGEHPKRRKRCEFCERLEGAK